MCTVFLAAIDQVCSHFYSVYLRVLIFLRELKTIVATALPTIVEQLGGGKNYSWVGTYVSVFSNASIYHDNKYRFYCILSAYLLASAGCVRD